MRYQVIDILRGVAIVLMILFHLNYSHSNIFNSKLLDFSETFWFIVGRFAAILFIGLAGFSYFLASRKVSVKELRKKYFLYSFQLWLIALCISFGTYIFVPEQFIAFGIIHFFALSFLLLPYILFSKTSLILFGIFFVLVGIFRDTLYSEFLFPVGITSNNFFSADYYPLIPWISIMILGYALGQLIYSYNFMRYLYIQRTLFWHEQFLAYIGKRSLFIYIIHQPIIVAILYVVFKIVP